jgi:hypothetical protein
MKANQVKTRNFMPNPGTSVRKTFNQNTFYSLEKTRKEPKNK